jgi:hypothetical protein
MPLRVSRMRFVKDFESVSVPLGQSIAQPWL